MWSTSYFVKSQNLFELRRKASVPRLINTEISFQEYKKAIVSLDSCGCFVDGKFLQNSAAAESSITPPITQEDKCKNELTNCIYIGCFASVWGHWITDTLKKIWYLKTEDCAIKISQGWKIVFISLNDGGNLHINHEMSTNQKELLKLAGIDTDKLFEITENTLIHNIVIPDNSLVRTPTKGMYFSKEFKDTIQNIANSVPEITDYEKVYFTRTSFNASKDFGEKQIENYFAKMGYKIIEPEKLSVTKQISILKSCNFFAACESSTSHNSIFCKPGTNVIILRKADYINDYTLVINQIADLNVTFIDAHHSVYTNKKRPEFGPFFMYVSPYLKKWAGVKYLTLPYWLTKTWLEYVFYCKHNKALTQTEFYLCLRYPKYLFGKIRRLFKRW